jgi:putative Holliday junction resolvase
MEYNGRVLAVDYGEKNIGLACSDELGLTVRPLPSIPNLGRRNFFKRLQAMVEALDIRKLVLGIPWNMDGSSGDSMRRMQRLMGELESYLRIPLIGVDERLSTQEAMEYWRTMSPRKQKRYRTADSLAAALILERYLKGESA